MATGKYAGVVKNLPKLPGVEPSRQQMIDAIKADIHAPIHEDDPGANSDDLTLHELIGFADNTVNALLNHEKRAVAVAGGPSTIEYARAYTHLRQVKEKFAEWEHGLNALLETYQLLMLERFDENGISDLNVDGSRINTFQEPYATVIDPAVFRDWCRARPDLVPLMTLPFNTMSKLVKDMILSGTPEPPGVSVYAKTTIRWTAPKEKGSTHDREDVE